MSFSPFDKPHSVTITLSYHDWKKLKRASISQRRSLTSLLNDSIHYAVQNLDRMGRAK